MDITTVDGQVQVVVFGSDAGLLGVRQLNVQHCIGETLAFVTLGVGCAVNLVVDPVAGFFQQHANRKRITQLGIAFFIQVNHRATVGSGRRIGAIDAHDLAGRDELHGHAQSMAEHVVAESLRRCQPGIVHTGLPTRKDREQLFGPVVGAEDLQHLVFHLGSGLCGLAAGCIQLQEMRPRNRFCGRHRCGGQSQCAVQRTCNVRHSQRGLLGQVFGAGHRQGAIEHHPRFQREQRQTVSPGVGLGFLLHRFHVVNADENSELERATAFKPSNEICDLC